MHGLSRTNDQTHMSQTFDQTTDVYAKAQAMFNAPHFIGPVAVIEYPHDSSTPTPTVNPDGSVSDDSLPSIDKAVETFLFSGLLYLVPTSDVSEKDLEPLSDYLYDNQHIALMVQFKNTSDAQNLDNHVKSYQNDKNKLHNVKSYIIPDESRQPVAQGAAYASINLPQDWKKIGNLSEFKPTQMTPDQIKAVDDAECGTVVNKADDYMFSNGNAMGGGYIDQFVDTQYSVDNFAHTAQHFLDNNKCNNDDATRNQLHQTLASKAGQLRSAGILIGTPVINVPSREDAPAGDLEHRVLNGVTIDAAIYDPIEKINGTLTILA